jgi:hypothetical protein
MNLAAVTADTLHRHLAARTPWRPDPPEPSSANCPGCGAPLRLVLAGPDDPDRLVGTCKAPRCGEVVTYRVCEGRFIVAERRRR